MKLSLNFYTTILISCLISSSVTWGQGTIIDSGSPTNKWILHNPEDSRKTLFIAPWYPGTQFWDFGAQTQFRSNGDVIFSGNMAVGTSTNTPATSKLEVYGDLRTTTGRFSSIYSQNTDGIYPNNSANLPGDAQLSIGANWTGGLSDLSLINSNIANTSGGGFTFWQMTGANSKRFLAYVRGDGNVGIGTTNPVSKLHINGGGLVLGTNAVQQNTDGNLSLGDIQTNSSPTQQTWGIGTTLLLNAQDYTSIGFHDSGNRVDFIRSGNGTIQLGYDGGWGPASIGLPSGVWNSNGNVGIGETNPVARLHLNGSFRQGGIGDFNIDAPGVIGGRLKVLENGNIGIGTTDPGTYKLAVEGKIGAREVEVKTGSWADFVFAKEYKLPSLETVELYIKAEKHLPNIPSADEVKTNGINLGEMNAKLLQKIEELTLYAIEQQKRIDQLEMKINLRNKDIK
jgi:hypothetical protein